MINRSIKYSKAVFYLLVVCVSTNVSGLPNTRFDHLTINDGLSQSSVRAIFQDSRGFMWFGTQDGLNMFDGYEFTQYRNNFNDPRSISDNFIYDITEDPHGNLWIATSGGVNKFNFGLQTFEKINFSNLPSSPELSEAVYSITVAKDGSGFSIWFTTNEGLFKYNPKDRQFDFYKIYNDKEYVNLDKKAYVHHSLSGEIWVATNMSGLYKLNTLEDIFERVELKHNDKSINNIQLCEIFEDSSGTFWFGSIHGLNKYNPQTKDLTIYKEVFEKNIDEKITTGIINSITEDDENNLWIATSGYGLICFNKESDSAVINLHDTHNDKSLSLDVAHKVYKDRSGVIWIGTDGKGIDIMSPYFNNFNLVEKSDGRITSTSIRTFFEDAYGNVWISGYNGLDVYDPTKNTFTNYYDRTSKGRTKINSTVYSITEDAEQPFKYLYFGTEGKGLYKFNFETKFFENIFYSNESYGENIITKVFDDGEGNLWFGTNIGLIKFDKSTGLIKKFFHDSYDDTSLSPQVVTDIFIDSAENFWIGTDKGSLNLMDRENETFTVYNSLLISEGIDSLNTSSTNITMIGNFIKCITEDSKENLWIGTTTGLFKLDIEKQNVTNYTVTDGLPNNVVYGILEDSMGNLWLSTNFGLSRFDPVEKVFLNYDYRDGLQSNEFNTNAYLKTSDGVFYFGGISGYNTFIPEKININDKIAPVVLTDFLLFNSELKVGEEINGRVILKKTIASTDTITLQHAENIFTLKMAVLDYSSVRKNLFTHKLEGFENQYSIPSPNRTITYTNLDPGEYIFRAMGANSDGVWNRDGIKLLIIVQPPFWLSWWFFTLIFVLGSLIIYSIYRYRVKRILELERLRLKIASDLHDEVGATLTKVSMRAQMLEMQINDDKESNSLRRISEQARDAVSTMQDIVWAIDSRNDSAKDLFIKIKDTASSILSEKNTYVDFKVDGIAEVENFTPEMRQNIYLISKEAVNNIAKHSNATEVKIHFKKSKYLLELLISDNGTNFVHREEYPGQGFKKY